MQDKGSRYLAGIPNRWWKRMRVAMNVAKQWSEEVIYEKRFNELQKDVRIMNYSLEEDWRVKYRTFERNTWWSPNFDNIENDFLM